MQDWTIEIKPRKKWLDVDIKGIWHNSKEYERNIISGMRPTFLIKDDYLTTGMIEFEDNLHNYERKEVSVWFGACI